MKGQLSIFNAALPSNYQKYYLKKPRFNDAYLQNNLPKVKNGGYVINPDEYKPIGTHWIVLYENGDNLTYFDSFVVEYIPKWNKDSLTTKISQQIFTEYKQVIQ